MGIARFCLLTVLVVSCVEAKRLKLSDKIVDSDVKKNILDTKLSAAEAYNKYMEAYTDVEDTMLLSSTDPVTLKATRRRQQKAFSATLKKCQRHNEKFRKGRAAYEMTVNSFSILDDDERQRFLGLSNNVSMYSGKYRSAPMLQSVSNLQALPSSFSWNDKGMMTAVKNQGSCGSCWTYAANGPIEYAYRVATGQDLQFSEQELLDCTYESDGYTDGCNGGWYTSAWDWVIEGSHLSSQNNYPYKGQDRSCSHNSHVNSLAGRISVTGYTQSTMGSEDAVLSDLVSQMPLAVAFFVEDAFYSIGAGVYDGCDTIADPNHAVTLTGYAAGYFEIKNSWGADWGTAGYGRLERGRDICGLLSYAYYISYKDLDNSDFEEETDDGSDDESDDGSDDGTIIDNSSCMDDKSDCAAWAQKGYCVAGHEYAGYMAAYCKKSCGDCTCADTKEDCLSYASSGYCVATWVDYMMLNCPITCEHCEPCNAGYFTAKAGCVQCPNGSYSSYGSTECNDCPTGTTSPAGSTSIRSCKRSTCDAGSYSSAGSCQVCPANSYSSSGATSCTACPSGTESDAGSASSSDCKTGGGCEDSHESCESWAATGYCTHSYVSYMEENCQNSCDLCVKCADADTDCASWASSGFCTAAKYETYMTVNCPSSCGLCGDAEEKEACGGGLTMCGDGVCRHVHLC